MGEYSTSLQVALLHATGSIKPQLPDHGAEQRVRNDAAQSVGILRRIAEFDALAVDLGELLQNAAIRPFGDQTEVSEIVSVEALENPR